MLIPLASASPLRLEGIGAGVGGSPGEAASSVCRVLQSESKADDARANPSMAYRMEPAHMQRRLCPQARESNRVKFAQIRKPEQAADRRPHAASGPLVP